MKKALLAILLFLGTSTVFAQRGDMVFYTANEEKFFLVINGVQQNAEPMSNIRLTEMAAPVIYNVRIKFVNPAIPIIDDKVSTVEDQEKSWIIQPQKKNGQTTGAYVVKVADMHPIEARTSMPNGASPSQVVVYHADPFPGNPQGEGVSFNMNVGENGANVTFSASSNSNHQVQTQSSSGTVITQSSSSSSSSTVSGGGCPMPLSAYDYRAQVERVRSQSTASGRTLVAEKIIQGNCLTSVQVYGLINELYLSNDKLALAKSAFHRVYDPQNYEEVYKAFSVSAQVRELDAYITQHGYNPGVVQVQPNQPIRTQPVQQPVVVYVPGYNGPVGCPRPMTPSDFAAAKAAIKDADFENTKMSTAKTVIGSNCLTTDQVAELCNLFDFENTKLDFAKFAYSRTYDKGNYFKVNKVFDFDASKEELNRFVQKNQ